MSVDIKTNHCGKFGYPTKTTKQRINFNKHKNIWENVYVDSYEPSGRYCDSGYSYKRNNGLCEKADFDTSQCRDNIRHSNSSGMELNENRQNPVPFRTNDIIYSSIDGFFKKKTDTRLGKKSNRKNIPDCPDGWKHNKFVVDGRYGTKNQYKTYLKQCMPIDKNNKVDVDGIDVTKANYIYSAPSGYYNYKNRRPDRYSQRSNIPDCPDGHESKWYYKTRYGPNNKYKTYVRKCIKKEDFEIEHLSSENDYSKFDRYDMHPF